MKYWHLILAGMGAYLLWRPLSAGDDIPPEWSQPPPGGGLRLPPATTSTQSRVMAYRNAIMRESLSRNVEPAVVAAIIDVESSGVADAVRYEANVEDYSYGLMQIRWTTADWLGYTGSREGLLNPDTNIEYGTAYLGNRYAKYPNTIDAIAAYNSGTPVVSWVTGKYANQDYIEKAVRRVPAYRQLFRWHFPGYDSVAAIAKEI